ncbi:MAG: ATP-binding protein [Lachnospiraceae bacterium]|nr:ATP-binding protein [Lachnospiraceae bacterium]
MNQFYCREEELKKLNDRYEDNDFECIIIYGRRRIGKTSLINEFCKDKPTIFFSALNTTGQENLESLSRAIMSYERPEEILSPTFRDYDAALNEITLLSRDTRIVFVIDEYPYLAKARPAISAMLQHMIDHKWSHSRLFLILCGSSMSFMEQQVLGQESPLYGRRTAQFKIEPLNYRETAVFHPEKSCEENALIYGITGGIPHYINKLNVKTTIDDALLQNLFDRSSYLYEEPSNLLKQELREPALYNAIITAIAQGASRLNEIVTKTGEPSSTCTVYLKSLIDLGIVKKETPVTEKPGKKTIYLLSDSFFRFWYRFVPSNINAIDSGRIRNTYQKAIKANLSDFMGITFERMCHDYLLYYDEELPIDLNEIGQWWGTDPKTRKQVQIDIIGTPAAGNEYIIGSCKYRNEKIGTDELQLLRKYASVFGKGSRYHYYIFSKSGFTEGLLAAAANREVTLVDLMTMYHVQPSDGCHLT